MDAGVLQAALAATEKGRRDVIDHAVHQAFRDKTSCERRPTFEKDGPDAPGVEAVEYLVEVESVVRSSDAEQLDHRVQM